MASRIRANAEGKLTNETLGNGLVTTSVYESASGRLQTILSGGGGSVQYLKYDFDALGNLERREDQARGSSETFGYDALNRLTETNTVAGGAAAPQSIGYDALGNITNKTDMGAYAYDPVRPHVVTRAGEHSYVHDANGNMVSGAG
ncbi:MAG: RHS repeat protein, partial [Gammaproteobacteria bacterium]|nr:RHS repeat protein [Gammaproteobacteria bacterium]